MQYADSAVELVDVSEVLEKGEATAALPQFVPALRRVSFSSTTAGSQDRVMELSVMELLTAAVIAKISWTRVINSPDPPEVHATPVPATYLEKAPLTVVDPEVQVRNVPLRACLALTLYLGCFLRAGAWPQGCCICQSEYLTGLAALYNGALCFCWSSPRNVAHLQVFHPDRRLIKAAKVWMEPMSASDVLLYEPVAVNATVKAAVSVTVDLQTHGWVISGHAHEDAYSQIFQVCWPWIVFRSMTPRLCPPTTHA